MSEYYLGDPCYVIPDDEWSDFCSIMRDDGEDFEYKDETCRVIGTGGDGDFGGLSVDAGEWTATLVLSNLAFRLVCAFGANILLYQKACRVIHSLGEDANAERVSAAGGA